jgi:PAS domain S-box-containing protein
MDNLKKIQNLTNTLNHVELNLKEENKLLEFLLEHSLDGYWDWNVSTGYEYLSPKFKQQLGFEDHEMENKPESWMSLCNDLDLGEAQKVIGKVLSGGDEEFQLSLRFTHKKGHEVKILCRGKLIKKSEEGTPLRMVGTHRIID